MTADAFSDFYRRYLPEVYGYLLYLCGGDVPLAEDLNQDVWLTLVDELSHGRAERADVRWLITVARTRFLDHVRRTRVGRSKLTLLRGDTSATDGDPTDSELLEGIKRLQPLHRAVLMMRYVEDLSVPAIAAAIGRPLPATNSLLARARAELRSTHQGTHDG
jgi:RNA polymerase sigma-70 factor (ECF subfamily)